MGILRHTIYDPLRKTCRERAVRVDPMLADDEQSWEESLFWLHAVAAECQLPSRRMELDEFRENPEVALGKLPPRIAQVFQLYAVEERSNRNVSTRPDPSRVPFSYRPRPAAFPAGFDALAFAQNGRTS